MNGGFDATALERGYAFFDECPDGFLDTAITLPIGDLRGRVRGIRAWRDALLDGRLPPADEWPPAEIAAPVRRALDALGIVRFCRNWPELVSDLLGDILDAFVRQDEAIRAEIAKRLRELEELERAQVFEREDFVRRIEQLAEQWGNRSEHAASRPRPFQLDHEARRRLRDRAEREVIARQRAADADLLGAWEEPVRAWAEIASVFGDLGQMLGRGWDLTLGVLRHTGWRNLLQLRQLVEHLPEFRRIVRVLGRLHASETAETVAEKIFVRLRRLDEEWLEVPTPLIPEETRGVERSSEIARMLPVEAAMLGHPKLRLLWHARRSEQALLTYRVEGIELEKTIVERETAGKADVGKPRRERGPILAIVDTSGSMHGLPEQVAKALVLEALRTAHAEKRRCRLYTFGGPGQTIEHELDLSPEGIGRFLEFLGWTFGGGSDPAKAMAGALRQIRDNEWAKADVLFVSDGEWPAPPDLAAKVQRAREAGTRFHGVQVGNRSPTGLHELCEPVHVFGDWMDMVYSN